MGLRLGIQGNYRQPKPECYLLIEFSYITWGLDDNTWILELL